MALFRNKHAMNNFILGVTGQRKKSKKKKKLKIDVTKWRKIETK